MVDLIFIASMVLVCVVVVLAHISRTERSSSDDRVGDRRNGWGTKLRVESTGPNCRNFRVLVDGRPVRHLRGLDLSIEHGSLATATIVFHPEGVEIDADVFAYLKAVVKNDPDSKDTARIEGRLRRG
jgi:hypothetical protein